MTIVNLGAKDNGKNVNEQGYEIAKKLKKDYKEKETCI